MEKQLINELKEMMKSGAGYLTISSFIKDFGVTSASVSEIVEDSENWKLSIKSGHKFQHLTGFNFGW